MRAFVSYSHRDEWGLERLHAHLAVLRREKLIEAWFDREILAGSPLDTEIGKRLAESELFLPIVSPDFLASNYCYDREMAAAIARHDAGSMRIVPIILEPCDWKASPLGKFKAIPKDGKPVTEWRNNNNAFLDVVTELRRIAAEEKRGDSAPAPAQVAVPKDAPRKQYRVKRDFDSLDRAEFRDASFTAIKEYFAESVLEVDSIVGIKARIKELGSSSFCVSILNTHRARGGAAHLTVHARSGRMGMGDIYYSHAEDAPENTANGGFAIESDEYELFLRDYGFGSGNQARRTAREAAEVLWNDLLDRAGIADA